jgi:beta-mannosidase
LHFPDVKDLGLEITPIDDGDSVALSTQRPVKGIVLEVEGEEVGWGDQAIDLVPGNPQIVKAIGLRGRMVKARFLGDGTA